jgi:hypothetical protein
VTLARRIPIQDRIFTTESLTSLLKELSGYYRKSTHEYRENRFSLSISEDEHTTTSIDSPPNSFEPLLNSTIHHLRLRINCDSPDRDIEFTISPGANSRSNCIILQSTDEDWVNLAHNNLSRLLNNVKPQSIFIKNNIVWLTPLLAVLIGWPAKKLFFWVLLKLGQAHTVPWSWAVFGQHLLFAELLGVLPALFLFLYAVEKAFPGIEFQTGPSHAWKESKMRNQFNVLFGLLVLGPLGSFVYDIYKAIMEH